jgi:hypothetical protein
MPNSILSNNLIKQIENCINKADLGNETEHSGLSGDIREIFLAEIIKPILPQGFEVGTGKIIDRKGNLSSQTDIIIYNSKRFPPLMFDIEKGIFPIDSVYYSIEVKTTVNATELKDSIKKASVLRKLEGEQPHFVLFGFSTDVTTAASDLSRIQKYQDKYERPPINIYCNIGQGYCYYINDSWKIYDSCEKYAEVVGLVVGIVNTLVNSPAKATNFDPGMYLAWWT